MREMMFYLLDGKVPYPVSSWREWSDPFFMMNRTVRESFIGDVRVSTVFLGLDHQYGDGPPILFETMIFNGPLDASEWRYSTWEEAEVGHGHAFYLVLLAGVTARQNI